MGRVAREAFSAAGEGSTIWLVPAKGGRAPAAHLDRRRRAGRAGRPGVVARRPPGLLRRGHPRLHRGSRTGAGSARRADGLRAHGVAWEKSGRSQVWTGFQAGNWFVWRVPVAPATGEPAGEPQVLASGGERACGVVPPRAVAGRARPSPTSRSARRYEILSQAVSPDGRAPGDPTPLVDDDRRAEVSRWPSRPTGGRLAFVTRAPGRRAVAVDGRPGLGRGASRDRGAGPPLEPGLVRGRPPPRIRVARGEERTTSGASTSSTGVVAGAAAIESAPLVASPVLSPDGKIAPLARGPQGRPQRVGDGRRRRPGAPAHERPRGDRVADLVPGRQAIAVELMRGGDTHVGGDRRPRAAPCARS